MFYVPPETLGAFAITCMVIELTPGPNMAYLAVLSAGRGRRAGFAATLGIGLGLALVGIGAAIGLATLISGSRLLYEILRWSGIGYLLWLAWDGWRDSNETSLAQPDTNGEVFIRGLFTNLLNPKAAVFYVAVLPTFIDVLQPALVQTMLLSVIYVLIATVIHTTIVLFAASASPFLQNPIRMRTARRGLSLVLGAIAVWFAITTAQ